MTALGRHEIATLNPLRSEAWRWWLLDDLWRVAYRTECTPRRTVRHHVDRYAKAGLVLHELEINGMPQRNWVRWNADAAPAVVAALETLGELLPVIREAPTRCPRGHVYTPTDQYPSGELLCGRCVEEGFPRECHTRVVS